MRRPHKRKRKIDNQSHHGGISMVVGRKRLEREGVAGAAPTRQSIRIAQQSCLHLVRLGLAWLGGAPCVSLSTTQACVPPACLTACLSNCVCVSVYGNEPKSDNIHDSLQQDHPAIVVFVVAVVVFAAQPEKKKTTQRPALHSPPGEMSQRCIWPC